MCKMCVINPGSKGPWVCKHMTKPLDRFSSLFYELLEDCLHFKEMFQALLVVAFLFYFSTHCTWIFKVENLGASV